LRTIHLVEKFALNLGSPFSESPHTFRPSQCHELSEDRKMDNGHNSRRQPAGADDAVEAITAAIRDLAYVSWARYRQEQSLDTSRAIFDRAYLGHYSTVDTYVIQLIDAYDLDAKLDAAIAEPFRRHVDIDVSALGRALVSNTVIYSLLAVPVGVWVFHEETR
jgi:hypothetical protein